MLRMDGSRHGWLEGRGGPPEPVLMGCIDDAGDVHGRFYDCEGTLPAMDGSMRITCN